MYRELDPGTQYARLAILEFDAPVQDRIFNIMFYRLVGRVNTHRVVGFLRLADFEAEDLEDSLRRIRASGQPPFTGAYMVSGYRSMGTRDKIVNVSRIFGRLHERFGEFYETLRNSPSLPGAYATITAQDGFGNFLAYQILVDLMYPVMREGGKSVLPFSPDEWAAAGPGAKRGIKLLSSTGRESNLAIMRWLRDHQRAEFERLSIRFEYLRTAKGEPVEISLANIQNCLCEFYKYEKIRTGTGRGRRGFDAARAWATSTASRSERTEAS